MPKDKVRRIVWHCAAGHDFEVEDELRRTICPICGGTGVERVEKKEDAVGRGKSGRGIRSWFWR
jgi:hypothetical protein